jgi:hypothetical protein
MDPSAPCVFYTTGGDGWYREPTGNLILRDKEIRFDSFVSETGEWEPIRMLREADGLYRCRDENGKEQWTSFLSETKTHVYLTGNFINDDQSQGVQIHIWPQKNVSRPSHANPI